MAITRRSRSNLGDGDDGSIASSNIVDNNSNHREREPLLAPVAEQPTPRPPPPPPPPPPIPTAVTANVPRPAAHNISQSRSKQNDGESNQQRQPEQPQIHYLQVRVSTPNYRPSKIYRRRHRSKSPNIDSRLKRRRKQQSERRATLYKEPDIVRVLIPPEGFVSEQQLSDCLNQACAASDDRNNTSIRNYRDNGDDGSWDSAEEYFEDRGRTNNVAGMFRGSDGVFVPLSVIHSQPRSFVDDVFSIQRPVPVETIRQFNTAPKGSIFITLIEMIGIITVVAASWLSYSASQSVDWDMARKTIHSLFVALVNVPSNLYDVLIDIPLKELYRHGPSLVGWEGEPLARICSRITHYGDEEFWQRNMEECEQIYASKEAAAMHIRKPILFGLFILILFYMVKSIIVVRVMHRQRLDPNIVETYRAITMLARQLRRAVNNK